MGRTDNADTDSGSDSDYDGTKQTDGGTEIMDENERIRKQYNNLELLEKRYEC